MSNIIESGRLCRKGECGDGKLRLTHVGQIYGNRTFAALVEGLTLLKKSHPEAYARLELRQVGFVCEAERSRVVQSEVADCFTLVGTVPYDESIEEMYRSDCLLVIDPVFDNKMKNVYIPGKLYDYLSTARPILCLADRDSATGDLAAATGCEQVDPYGGAVCEQLAVLLSGQLPPVNLAAYERPSCQEGSQKLDETFKRCMDIVFG